MKIVHAADAHVDSPMLGLRRIDGAPAEQIRCATRRAFERLIDLCLEEAAELLLLAGDLFHQDAKDYNTSLFVIRQLARLRETDTRVALVWGNHDAESVITKRLDWPEHVLLFGHRNSETKRLSDLGVALHGQSFARRNVTENLAAGFPPPVPGMLNIGVLHTNVNGVSEHDPYAPATLSQLAGHGYDYWALGHIHTRVVLQQDPWVVYPGNLQGLHIRETGARGCVVIDVEDGRIRSARYVDTDVVRWENVSIDLEGVAELADVLAAVTHALTQIRGLHPMHPLLVRVTLCGATSAHERLHQNPQKLCAEIEARCAGTNAWVERVDIRTTSRTFSGRAASDSPNQMLDFLHALDRELSALETDEDALRAYAGSEIQRLQQVAGRYLMLESDCAVSDPAYLRSLLPRIRDVLLSRLQAGEA